MKIAIFYHTFQSGMSAFIYQQQIHRLYSSGLIEAADYIHIGVNGDQEMFNAPEKAKIVYNTNWKEETETLVSLKEFAYQNPDYKILYFHMKGASKETLVANAWRLMMEYFVIDKWKECIEYLNDYDVVGSNLKYTGPTTWSDGTITTERANIPHFVGNFWWTNAYYIQTLNDEYLNSNYRLDRETWIGTGHGDMKSLYQPNDYEPYTHFYREKDYVS